MGGFLPGPPSLGADSHGSCFRLGRTAGRHALATASFDSLGSTAGRHALAKASCDSLGSIAGTQVLATTSGTALVAQPLPEAAQTQFSLQEEATRLQTAWKSFAHFVWLAGCPGPEELASWVAQPDQLVINRRQTVITASDQIPVWLRPEAGETLRPRQEQAEVGASRAVRGRAIRKVAEAILQEQTQPGEQSTALRQQAEHE